MSDPLIANLAEPILTESPGAIAAQKPKNKRAAAPIRDLASSDGAARLRALATDYDGTLAHNGAVKVETLAALKRIKASGRRLILVTGRELNELTSIFPDITLFDLAVMENGAVLHEPATSTSVLLAPAPPSGFVARLHEKGLPIQVGQVIVATWEPHENEVMSAIKEMQLELQVIFNKGAVMILPTGVNKASGLLAALKQMGLGPEEAVGMGDAENDHAFLKACGLGVAVANALPALKERADHVTTADHGAGVVELIEGLLSGTFDAFSRNQPAR